MRISINYFYNGTFFHIGKHCRFTGWGIIPLDQYDVFVLTGDPASPVKVRKGNRDYSRTIIIRENTENGDDMFVLLTPAEAKQQVRINNYLASL
jgi:hypothetical protein